MKLITKLNKCGCKKPVSIPTPEPKPQTSKRYFTCTECDCNIILCECE